MKKNDAPRVKEMRSVQQALERFVTSRGGKERLHLNALWENWPYIMGEDLASLGWPMGHKESTLLVGAEDNMAMQELTLQAYEILERANAFMDSEYFTAVKVTLLQGRRVLSEQRAKRRVVPTALAIAPPARLGGLLGKLDPNSPFSHYYEAYVRSFTSSPGGGK